MLEDFQNPFLFYTTLAHMLINLTLTFTNKSGHVPEFHLLIRCQEVKLDSLRAVL